MSKIVLSCSGVKKSFSQYLFPTEMLQDRILRWRRHRRKWTMAALDDINLEVREGEWVGIYGPNGAGKSTLLRILAGLMPPDAGTVHIEGKMSCFFELGTGFHPEQSAAENIYMHGLLHGLPPSAIRSDIDDIISFAGVRSHRDLPIKCYSTGMIQRLAFAASSRIDADIYIFDEILAVGDKEFQNKCRAHLLTLKKKGKTAIIVLHNLDSLHLFCDRVIHLNGGKITEESHVSEDQRQKLLAFAHSGM